MVFVLAPLLLLLLSGSSPVVRAADHGDGYYTTVATSSLKPNAIVCLGHRVTPPANRSWVPVDLAHGPCSSSLDAAAPSVTELLHRDQLRADDVQKRLSNNGTDNNEAPGQAPTSESDAYGKAKIKVRYGSRKPSMSTQADSELSVVHPAATTGSGGAGALLPGVVQTVVLDTASDVAWVQCVPCPIPPCHPQQDSFYDPTNSGSYAAFPCNSPACTQLGPYANGCVNGQCQYRVTYPDGSSTSGTYSSDLLTLNPTSSVNNFQFGCSHADQGSFDPQAAGIMALGGGPESLASQTSSTYGKVFSYCLPPSPSYLGFFILGDARVASSRYAVTPLLRDPRAPATFYRVLLRAIVVAGKKLDVPATAFAAGAVMDSRTAITRLPPTAYRALRAAFMSSMRMYRTAPPKGILDTCYDFTGVRSVRLPKITLVFDRDAAVQLDPSGVLYNDCLAFAANKNDAMPGIIGNVQQQTIEVVYDVAGGAVAFRRNAC
ncbi:hypothetical protein EJB05_46785 [Eragrostis curvula]|uniref:Peptidase A1 domain-containing protein n=1 Tax=Eragrostis curvula TaxID=38414 RepID=A0A5J9TP79_9POAL|nr:hypothetical protein EJB05_46776 [Eragrostis curvula]TVU13109.1 hypothetical protein EJB05_46785 [Eragrostis curvula]